MGKDAPGEGDVAGFHIDVRVLREGLNDGEKGIGGKCRGFVGFGVDDGRRHDGNALRMCIGESGERVKADGKGGLNMNVSKNSNRQGRGVR